mmetsp:Transcript_43377/g.111983  ORF Transcript_43377/g.111983 Transcript_43377/m.111983 type:complete len:175 (+) Transcript_43377:101-625(+)
MSFAEGLTQIVAESKRKQEERERQATKWGTHEDKLLEKAVDMFKRRCMREAELEKCEAAVSFEVLTRDIEDFPSRLVKDGQHLVDDWGDGAAAWWFYANKGSVAAWNHGTPVLFAELLESMMPKFLERVKALGFRECARVAGTWKVTASWATPKDEDKEPPKKRSRRNQSDSDD